MRLHRLDYIPDPSSREQYASLVICMYTLCTQANNLGVYLLLCDIGRHVSKIYRQGAAWRTYTRSMGLKHKTRTPTRTTRLSTPVQCLRQNARSTAAAGVPRTLTCCNELDGFVPDPISQRMPSCAVQGSKVSGDSC